VAGIMGMREGEFAEQLRSISSMSVAGVTRNFESFFTAVVAVGRGLSVEEGKFIQAFQRMGVAPGCDRGEKALLNALRYVQGLKNPIWQAVGFGYLSIVTNEMAPAVAGLAAKDFYKVSLPDRKDAALINFAMKIFSEEGCALHGCARANIHSLGDAFSRFLEGAPVRNAGQPGRLMEMNCGLVPRG